MTPASNEKMATLTLPLTDRECALLALARFQCRCNLAPLPEDKPIWTFMCPPEWLRAALASKAEEDPLGIKLDEKLDSAYWSERCLTAESKIAALEAERSKIAGACLHVESSDGPLAEYVADIHKRMLDAELTVLRTKSPVAESGTVGSDPAPQAGAGVEGFSGSFIVNCKATSSAERPLLLDRLEYHPSDFLRNTDLSAGVLATSANRLVRFALSQESRAAKAERERDALRAEAEAMEHENRWMRTMLSLKQDRP